MCMNALIFIFSPQLAVDVLSLSRSGSSYMLVLLMEEKQSYSTLVKFYLYLTFICLGLLVVLGNCCQVLCHLLRDQQFYYGLVVSLNFISFLGYLFIFAPFIPSIFAPVIIYPFLLNSQPLYFWHSRSISQSSIRIKSSSFVSLSFLPFSPCSMLKPNQMFTYSPLCFILFHILPCFFSILLVIFLSIHISLRVLSCLLFSRPWNSSFTQETYPFILLISPRADCISFQSTYISAASCLSFSLGFPSQILAFAIFSITSFSSCSLIIVSSVLSTSLFFTTQIFSCARSFQIKFAAFCRFHVSFSFRSMSSSLPTPLFSSILILLLEQSSILNTILQSS